MSRNVVVVGADKVARVLRAIVPSVRRKYVAPAMISGLEPIASAARANTPVRTGRTRRAIKVVTIVRDGRVLYAVIVDRADFPTDRYYPPWVEYGTSKMPGRHFMLRAYTSHGGIAAGVAASGILAGVLAEASRQGKGRR